MNKGQLIDVVAASTKLKKTEVAKVLDSFLDSVKVALKKGNDVSLVGFGTWKKKKRAARTGRNPQTGKSINIPAKNTVVFTAGKKLKDAVN
jgi:DNA-binding protein HU-beta